MHSKLAGYALYYIVTLKPTCSGEMSSSGVSLTRDISPGDCRSKKNQALKIQTIFAAGTTISSTRASEVNNVRVGAPQNLLAELNKNLQFQLAQNSNE